MSIRSKAFISLLAILLAGAAQGAKFHLSENGACNMTGGAIGGVWAVLDDCSEGCDTCEMQGTSGMSTGYGQMDAGACATATFELDTGCKASVFVSVAGTDLTPAEGRCIFNLNVSSGGHKTIDLEGCTQIQDFELVPHHGGEHFQIDIKPGS